MILLQTVDATVALLLLMLRLLLLLFLLLKLLFHVLLRAYDPPIDRQIIVHTTKTGKTWSIFNALN